MTRLALTLAAVLMAQVTVSHVALAQDFSNVRSGMLLGIYTSPGYGGMRVSSLIPGYSAEGRLYPGDVLLRVAVDQNQVYRVRSLYEMENAKMMIGPNREAALEIWRPNQGVIYAWVEFTPLYGPAAAATAAYGAAPTYGSAPAPAQRSYAAQFRMESEKSGARALFQGKPSGGYPSQGGNAGGFPGKPATPKFPNVKVPQVKLPHLGHVDPSRLFNR
jgi:hypothetical protein